MVGFIIIGNKNTIVCKDIFPLFKENRIWFGVSTPKDFTQPDNSKIKSIAGLARWFTNVDNKKKHEFLELHKKYSTEDYPKYDNYDAIEVSRVDEIPMDYDGVMGVPITFLYKYNPKQFEILWQASGNAYANAPKKILEELKFNPNIKYGGGLGTCILNGKPTYSRILIRKIKEVQE